MKKTPAFSRRFLLTLVKYFKIQLNDLILRTAIEGGKKPNY